MIWVGREIKTKYSLRLRVKEKNNGLHVVPPPSTKCNDSGFTKYSNSSVYLRFEALVH